MDPLPENIPSIGDFNLPRALNSQQAQVFELLRQRSRGIRQFQDWYQGALDVLASHSPDRFAQAANSIREICDGLAKEMGVPDFKNPTTQIKQIGPKFIEVKENFYNGGWEGETINAELDATLRRFAEICSEPARTKRFGHALAGTDPHAAFLPQDWRKERDRAFKKVTEFFQSVTHHGRAPTETEFREQLESFEFLLLNYLTPCTAPQQKELLALIAGPATEQAFVRISELIKHKAANYSFLFDKMDNPAWLPMLEKKGFFDNLPGPEPSENGSLVYRHHLPLMVLTRLAGSAPQAVSDILLKLRLPENPQVGSQVLQCLSNLKDVHSIRKLGPLIEELGKSPTRTTWLWAEEMLKSWMGLEVFPQIFTILRCYFRHAVATSSEDSESWLALQIDEKQLATLAARFPMEVCTLMFNALYAWAALRCREYPPSERGQDTPYTGWLEDFKDATIHNSSVEEMMAKRLFATAQQIYREGDLALIAEVDKLLQSDDWLLFRRLRWQLYADFPSITLDSARAEVLLRIGQFRKIDSGFGRENYEFVQLLVSHVAQHGKSFLTADEIETYVNVVLAGPLDNDGKLVKCDDNHFYQMQLWPIAPLLEGRQLQAYENCCREIPKITLENYRPYGSRGVIGGEVITIAPEEAESLGEMSDEQLWAFLNTWEAKEDHAAGRWIQESVYVLASKFADLVDAQAQRFNPANQWWKNISRREFFEKLLERAASRIARTQNSGAGILEPPSLREWDNWFGTASWVMSQGWQRTSVSRFIAQACETKFDLPDEYCSACGELLRQLFREPDPRLMGNENAHRDWLTTAINSVHGEALDAVLNLALRQKNAGQEIETWIFELLKNRLARADESPAIFALLGARLRFLVYLFEKELSVEPELLFPSSRPSHRAAAVMAHFVYDQPWDAILRAFPNFLNVALQTLAETETSEEPFSNETRRNFGAKIGIHIACYDWHGALGSDANAFLDRFFEIANKTSRTAAIGQIGTIWRNAPKDPSNGALPARAMDIFQKRLSHIAGVLKSNPSLITDYETELTAYSKLLRCESFPLGWRVEAVKEALRLLAKVPRSYHLLRAITEFGILPERNEAMLSLLLILLQKPSDELRWSMQFKDLAPVIEKGLASDNPQVRRLAESCKDLLLRMGLNEFLEVGGGPPK